MVAVSDWELPATTTTTRDLYDQGAYSVFIIKKVIPIDASSIMKLALHVHSEVIATFICFSYQ